MILENICSIYRVPAPYALIHTIFGFNPFWYHLLNVLIHVSAACAIFYFFYLLTSTFKNPSSTFHPLSSFLIALMFLIHPVQTEAVSYISGLSDPLFVLFGFLSLILFHLYITCNDRYTKHTSHPKHLWYSLTFFILSILSKETGVVFLGLLSLYWLLFLSNFQLLTKSLSALISSFWSYIAISLVYLWFHFQFINKLDMAAAWGNNLYAHSLTVRLLTFVNNLPTYFSLLIFPKDLFMERDYTVPIQTQPFNPSLIIFIIAITFIIFALWKFRKNLGSDREKLLIFCFLGFFLSLLPYSGIVLINGLFYEHFLYLPLVFFFAFWIILLEKFLKTKPTKVIILIIIITFIIRNLFRQFDWNNAIRFYSQTLSHAPQSIRIRNGLAMAHADQGDYTNSIKQYQIAIQQNPSIPNLYHNLANTYLATGNITSAEEYYLKAIEVDPKFLFSWQALANLYKQTGQKDKLAALVARYQSSGLR